MQIEKDLLPIIHNAGKEILKVYSGNFKATIKSDQSPLTEADQISHKVITEGLKKNFPHIPIISEEGSSVDFDVRSQWTRYFLIDPLDGTKEFVKRNGEFTVNISLIENNKPTMGIIHIPIENKTFWGGKNHPIMEFNNGEISSLIPKKNINEEWKILVSRSHKNSRLENGIRNIKEKITADTIEMGSSKKFCILVSNEAMIYPRFGPTSEWDIAAGHALIESMGGIMKRLNGNEVGYNSSQDYIIPDFVAGLDRSLIKTLIEEL